MKPVALDCWSIRSALCDRIAWSTTFVNDSMSGVLGRPRAVRAMSRCSRPPIASDAWSIALLSPSWYIFGLFAWARS